MEGFAHHGREGTLEIGVQRVGRTQLNWINSYNKLDYSRFMHSEIMSIAFSARSKERNTLDHSIAS